MARTPSLRKLAPASMALLSLSGRTCRGDSPRSLTRSCLVRSPRVSLAPQVRAGAFKRTFILRRRPKPGQRPALRGR